MVLPHYLSIYDSGEVILSDEYSEYQWVKIADIEAFEPKIPNIPHIVETLLKLITIASEPEFVII